MKKKLFTLMLALVAIATTAVAQVTINATNFPDENFRNYVKDVFDTDNDGVLSQAEIKDRSYISVSNANIKSLAGIEYLIVRQLDCNNNQLTKLDLSNQTELFVLNCYNNQLTKLDLSNNPKLERLNCHNNKLTELNVSGCTNLQTLNCRINQIKGLDMQRFINSLPTMAADTKFDVIDTKNDNEGNVITKSQVKYAKSKYWIAYDNYGGSMRQYSGSDPDPTVTVAIDSKNFPDQNFRNFLLAQSYGKDGKLSGSEIADVSIINVSDKNIANLKGIEYFTELITLLCYDNQLTSLDVSLNTALQTLYCYDNQLTSLDVSNNLALKNLMCNGNQLKRLDFSNNKELTSLSCYSNQIKGDNMEALVGSLPRVIDKSFYVIDTNDDNEGNLITKEQVAIAKGKGWQAYDYKGGQAVGYSGSNATGISINSTNFPDDNFRNWLLAQEYGKDDYLTDDEIAAVTSMNVSSKSIKNLKGIEYFTALTQLFCSENELTSLDVSKNTKLQTLSCMTNKLTSLNVSGCSALSMLFCYDNKLTELNLSTNTKLTTLYCYVNQIKGDKMQALVESLPKVTDGKFWVINTKNTNEQNVITKSQVAVAKGKGWSVYDNNGGSGVVYDGVIAIDATNFPDEKFRNWVLAQEYGKDGYLTDAEIAAVTTMNVSSKSIKNLKGIDYFTALQTLYCHKNQLTELDVSKNTNLSYLECGTNQLTELNVSANTNLQTIWCNNNQLTALDVSKNKKLTALYCYVNQIKGDKMQTLVNSLPTVSGSSGKFHVIDTKNSSEGNVITTSQVAVATGKNWKVYDRNGTTPVEYEGSDTPTGLTAVESGQLTVDSWYSIDGKRLNGEPTRKGVYIVNGKKVVK